MSWSLRELSYFTAVADTGSFTDAASILGVSQAAVSRSVAGIEQRLGQTLLRRTSHGCEPTALGVDLLPQARRILAEVSTLDELIRTRHSRLRLGYAWAAIGRHTTPLLRTWPKIHPNVDLQLVQHNSSSAGLAEGFCDVAVIRTEVDASRFDSVTVGLERRMAAFASDDQLWRRRRRITLAEVADRTIVIDPRTGTTTGALWKNGEGPDTTVETTSVEEWLDAIVAGKGVGTTAEATAVHHSRVGVTYRPIKDGSRVPVHLAWWRNDPPAELSVLIELITSLYARPTA